MKMKQGNAFYITVVYYYWNSIHIWSPDQDPSSHLILTVTVSKSYSLIVTCQKQGKIGIGKGIGFYYYCQVSLLNKSLLY